FLALPCQPPRLLGNSGSRLSLGFLCVSSQVFFQLRNLFLQCAKDGRCAAQFALAAKLFELPRAVAGVLRQENAERTSQGVGQGCDFVRVLALQRFLQSSDAFRSVVKKRPNHFVQELFVATNAPQQVVNSNRHRRGGLFRRRRERHSAAAGVKNLSELFQAERLAKHGVKPLPPQARLIVLG